MCGIVVFHIIVSLKIKVKSLFNITSEIYSNEIFQEKALKMITYQVQ